MKKNQRNKDGDLDGYWEYYYANGKLSSKGNYKDGKAHGLWEDYHSDGKLSAKTNYKNGDVNGSWVEAKEYNRLKEYLEELYELAYNNCRGLAHDELNEIVKKYEQHGR